MWVEMLTLNEQQLHYLFKERKYWCIWNFILKLQMLLLASKTTMLFYSMNCQYQDIGLGKENLEY